MALASKHAILCTWMTTAPTVNKRVINIGSGEETSIRALAQIILQSVGEDIDLMYKEDQDTGPSRMCADIQLAKEKLGYQPHYSLGEGLAQMIAQDTRFQP
jgi:UDP-glucose 4-epimerase